MEGSENEELRECGVKMLWDLENGGFKERGVQRVRTEGVQGMRGSESEGVRE